MVTNSYLALTLALTGDASAARALSSRSLQTTRSLGHPFSLCYGLSFAAWLALELDDAAQGLALAEEAQALSSEHRSAIMLAMSRVLIGWARHQQHDFRTALTDIRHGIAQFEQLGAGVLMPYWHGLLALATGASGDPVGALAAIDHGLSLPDRTHEHWSTAELLRIRARPLTELGRHVEAAASLERSIELSRVRQAALFEHRACADRDVSAK